MERPEWIAVPALHAGVGARISWGEVGGASGYSLQRAVDGGAYATVYGGAATGYRDSVPAGAGSLRYRVQSYASGDVSWNERDGMALNWAQWDARGGMWGESVSDWTESEEVPVTPNTAPVISGEDRHLGAFFEGFAVRFSVQDPDPEARVDAVARLDGEVLARYGDAVLGQDYEVAVSDEAVAGMAAGSEHELAIEASDNNGAVALRRYGFTAVEDVVGGSVFYVMRDGVAVARLEHAREWVDHLAVGTHSYVVRGVDRRDNFVDSNEVTLTLELPHPLIADVEEPGAALSFALRRGADPAVLRATELVGGRELQFEGRALPVLVGAGAARRSYSLSFTSVSQEDYEALGDLIGRTVVYRDHYGQRIFGVLSRLEQEHRRRGTGGYDAVVDFSLELREMAYSEEVAYD